MFRFRPKPKGVVFFQATKRNYLMGTARVRVRALALYEDVGGTAEDERVQEVSGLDAV